MLDSLLSCSRGALITLSVLTLLYFLENFDRYLIGVSPIPYIDYGSYEYSLLAGPVFTVVYTVGGLFFALHYHDSGRAADKGGGWRLSKLGVLSLCSGIFSMAFTATALCTEFWQQVIIRTAMGLAQSVITPFSTSIIKEVFPAAACGTAFGVFNAGTYFAFSFSLSMGTYLYHAYGWEAGYLLFGIIGMAVAVLVPLLSYVHTPAVSQQQAYHMLGEGAGVLEESIRVDVTEDASSVSSSSQHSSTIDTTTMMHDSQSKYIISPFASPEGSAGTEEVHDHMQAVHRDSRGRERSSAARMRKTLRDILFKHWWTKPGVLLVCIATGVRLGGGYIWSSYTGVFYSELFVIDSDADSCQYSYNSTAMATGSMCSSEYPYCVSGDCSALSDYPWHNEGMAALRIEEFMSWVPIVGSALGSMLGGVLSDHLVRKYDNGDAAGMQALSMRALISGISNLLALPLIAYSFFLGFPGCFLIYIASGMMGEVYLSQALALVTDQRVIPSGLLTPSVALFMLIITIIGGNSPLLVPGLLSAVGYGEDVSIAFTAASADPAAPAGEDVSFSVLHADASQMQYTLMYALGGCYGLSGLLYLWAYAAMVKDSA